MNIINSQPSVLIRSLPGLSHYEPTIKAMEEHVDKIIYNTAGEELWLLEHPPLYTLGTSANVTDIITPHVLPHFQTGRGGQVTYHGPGQRIGYIMLDLRRREQDLRKYIWLLEEWLITSLKSLGVKGERRQGRVGIWVTEPQGQEAKIAAIGVRIKKWVTFHGISLNINPDLSHYDHIVPCGLNQYGVTSLEALGITVTLSEIDEILVQHFYRTFEDKSFLTTLVPC